MQMQSAQSTVMYKKEYCVVVGRGVIVVAGV